QLLPFAKLDPCLGYDAVYGFGLGCMFGIASTTELAVRALLLGAIFGVLHRWYVNHQSGYWATLFYLCLCLWSYYTFRASWFYFVYSIAYRFVPMLIGVRLVQIVLDAGRSVLLPARPRADG